MLSSRHFDEFGSPKNWDDLVNEKIVVRCKKCGKWIWSQWHIYCWNSVNRKAKFERMEYCANCLPDNLW